MDVGALEFAVVVVENRIELAEEFEEVDAVDKDG